jgi:signal transduction histidine kinase
MEPVSQTRQIVLVDDEKDIRDVLQIALMDFGYEVLLAENGQQALELFEKSHPPIVITDIKMPGMDGIELLRRIKRENPDTEVVMITGHGDMDLAIRSLKHEATDFITKPINVDALDIALKRVWDKIVIREKLREYTTHLEDLIREKTELQDHLSSLGLMIGSISHGIKGLLTGLDGGMYLLEKGLTAQDKEKIQDGWETVKMMVERVRKMVMDILFYAKKRDLAWEQIDVSSFAGDVARLVAAKIKDLPIEFNCSIDTSVGDCSIDPGYVHAALMSLFDNAIDACQQKPERLAHRITFGVHPSNGSICFTVSDTGVGMDEETQSKLFTRFFSSKGRKGTGLGLFIANKIVEQHNGTITVSSIAGRGSRFVIKLPRKVAHATNPDGA